jgi:hypothetical protein
MALQMVSAMQPFAEAGLVNLSKLAEYVLNTGFGVKNASAFLQEAPPPQGPEGMPPGMEGMPPEGMPPEMEAEQGGMEGLPPELLAILQGSQAAPPQEQLPPELAGLPPELLAALLGGQGGPPQEQLPPELAGLPPELLAALQGQAPQQ